MGSFFLSSPINGQRGEVGECRKATRRSLSLILSSDWSDSLRVLVLRPRIMRRIAVVAWQLSGGCRAASVVDSRSLRVCEQQS